ncbi:hypothetical protein ABZY10_18530, partial [Streptomyces sp. NPDC006539]|uniref:hypothetical protein n=1 Tax=Streptomyces sp. NPDC006539 TaxID=3155352 RepID=UPI0033B3B8D0
ALMRGLRDAIARQELVQMAPFSQIGRAELFRGRPLPPGEKWGRALLSAVALLATTAFGFAFDVLERPLPVPSSARRLPVTAPRAAPAGP